MHEKRYQVFISSTYEDLKEERRAVQDVVISTGDFPVQMESFPAADEDQFEFIKTLIDQCDYYVLIIAGRYGTVAEDGQSYTHKEFQYAVSKGVPVLVMLHGSLDSIPAGKSEETATGKRRLNDFIAEAQHGRLRRTWDTLDGLKLAVREALDHSKATKPRTGWVPGDAIASLEALEELNEVRKENEKFREAIGHLEIELALPPIPAADETLEIDLFPLIISAPYGGDTTSTYARIRCSWIGAFPIFYSALEWGVGDWNDEHRYYKDVNASREALGAAFAAELAEFDTKGLYTVSLHLFERLASYYVETGLMVDEGEHPFTDAGNRLARRHRIADAGQGVCSIVKGDFERKYIPPSNVSDDEIPF